MSAQTITLKFKDVNIEQITCELVKMGQDTIPLIKYGPDKKILYIQGPWIKMKQYGIPAGEFLSNGVKNEYYTNEESRLSVRFPVDINCCVEIDGKTNSDEIQDFQKFKQRLDARVKSEIFMKMAGIDLDDEGKYSPIYKKPVKSKKTGKDTKEKYYSVKTKLDTERTDPDKKIKTEFYLLDKDTNQYKLVNTNNYITLDKVEETLKYNSEVLPIFQLVKVWTQPTNAWGITLKLKKIRIKNPVYSEVGDAIFLDDENDEQSAQEKVMPPKPPAQQMNKKIVEVESDDESDDESDEEVPKVVANKLKAEESDSESDEEPVKPKQATKIVNSESESDEDVKPKKPVKKVTKAKKASA